MSQFWDERFSGEEYIYGVEPNEYLKQQLQGQAPGRILFPAEGEGRNAVYAAQQGWQAEAFDSSREGRRKALLLAEKNKVALKYLHQDVEAAGYPAGSFDALALIYAHFPEAVRREYHQKLISFLKPGGLLILEGFSKLHVKNQQENSQAGGPKDLSMLFDLKELKKDFSGFDFKEAVETETHLKEGRHHKGKASVIRITAIKK